MSCLFIPAPKSLKRRSPAPGGRCRASRGRAAFGGRHFRGEGKRPPLCLLNARAINWLHLFAFGSYISLCAASLQGFCDRLFRYTGDQSMTRQAPDKSPDQKEEERSILQFVKDYWWVAVAILVAFLIAAKFVRPAPPGSLELATGSVDGAYTAAGEAYKPVFEPGRDRSGNQDRCRITGKSRRADGRGDRRRHGSGRCGRRG